MVPIREGELLIELGPMVKICPNLYRAGQGREAKLLPRMWTVAAANSIELDR